MAFSEILGQSRVVNMLKMALCAKSLHHAWLFLGPDGVGKELTALALAQALTCSDKPDLGCGTCTTCQRVASRNHPDVVWILPEDEMVSRGLRARSDFDRTPSREIRIDQIRALQERLMLRALEARHKIAIIVSAHAMNVAAQNALLKTLEEPPGDSHLILVSASSDRLLPTIRSRCAKASFAPLASDLVASWLMSHEKLDAAQAGAVAAMADGSIGRAQTIDAALLRRRKEVIDDFEQLGTSDARSWLRFAETWADERLSAEGVLAILNVWLHDLALAHTGFTGFTNQDLGDLARASASQISALQIKRRSSIVAETQLAIMQRNGSPRLQFERMLIRMFAA